MRYSVKSEISITTAKGHQQTHKGTLDFAFVGYSRDILDILHTYPHLDGRPMSELPSKAYDHQVYFLDPIQALFYSLLEIGEVDNSCFHNRNAVI